MKKYSLYYSGGSGGYMFYQGLNMLLGVHTNQQWPTNNFKYWKDFEIRLSASCVNLYCNITTLQDKLPSILLYTDKYLHHELAYLKKANWYYKNNNQYYKMIGISFYNDVKDDSWPTLYDILEFKTLDTRILNELYNVFDMPSNPWLIKTWVDQSVELYNTIPGTNVATNVIDLFDITDYKFLLQDVIKTKFKCVSERLNLTHLPEVEDHVDMWVNLHPKEIQEMLLK